MKKDAGRMNGILLLLQPALAFFQSRGQDVHGALVGIFTFGELFFRQGEFRLPLAFCFLVQGQDVVFRAAVTAGEIHPGGQDVGAGDPDGAVGIFFKGYSKDHPILGVAGGA